MSADSLLQAVIQALFVLVFIVVTVKALRRPWPANVDIALFFGDVSLIVAVSWIATQLRSTSGPVLSAVTSALLMALPYLLLRLVDDFADVPRRLLRFAEAGLTVSVVGIAVTVGRKQPLPGWLTVLLVAYFAGLMIYVAVAFARAARRSSGVTRRRMQAVAGGTLALGLTIVMAGAQALLPAELTWWTVLARIFSLLSGIGYFVGFAPPAWLKRAWQEPEVRAFLGRAASLPRLPNTQAIVREMERGAAGALGAPHAAIALWDEDAQVLRATVGDAVYEGQAGDMAVGTAFATQRAVFWPDAARADPAHAATYRQHDANAVLAVPITAGQKRLGVLTVYAARAPIFADDDIVLAQLLADQAAVILESRALIDEAARVRAREEATRLKDDFLSAAAHDLKTPLTTLIAQAQLLERRAGRDPSAPADLPGIRRMVQEAERLKRLVLDVLDVARLEQGKLAIHRETVDLVTLAHEACARHASAHHQCLLDADEPVVGDYDPVRIAQLLDNLIENAVKYSPGHDEVRVTVWREGEDAHLTVSDQGIGIAASDMPHLFNRFHRGTNVDDRHFAGMGLGLFICRGIVEQHSGSMRATSPGPGLGSTFHVVLPIAAPTTETEPDGGLAGAMSEETLITAGRGAP